jgi:hypothetical protein
VFRRTLSISGGTRHWPLHAVIQWRIDRWNRVRHHKDERTRMKPLRP